MGAPEPPPPIIGPELQNLTFDQLASLIEELSPDSFYERAQAFDLAMARFGQVQEDFERQTRNMWSAWSGRIAESFDDLARKLTGGTAAVVQAMASPGYGAALRRAGDALARAQQRIKDLRAQNRLNDHEAARQVLYDLGTVYQDIGTAMSPMPGGLSDVPVSPGTPVLPVAGTGEGEPLVREERHDPMRPGGHAAGGIVMPIGALLRPGEARRNVWSGHGSSPAPAAPSKEPDGVVPVMLGRAAPSEGVARPRDHGQIVVGGVLGRQTQAKKAKKQVTEHPATAQEGQQQEKQKERNAEREGARTDSEGPARHQPSTPEPLTAGTTAETHAVVPVVAPSSASPTAHVQAAPPAQTSSPAAPSPVQASAPAAPPPAQVSAPAAPPPAQVNAPASSPQGSLPTAHLSTPGPAGSAQAMGSYAPDPHPVNGPSSAPGVHRSPGTPPVPGAFQSAGGLDPMTSGMPPAAQSVSGVPRSGGDMGTGGFMGGMAQGMPGQEKATKGGDPAGFLTAGAEAWVPDEAGVPVLGRRAPLSPSADDNALAAIEAITRVEDREELLQELDRLRRREGS
ncbi:hypothetical protein [Amycolatopsis sp. lyj-90]|uniref:hypothetical protein n=1 Tax=Amycolatopsis sp. lyj-90 TaxID=2789285 RepID=UPI00397BE428